MQINHYNVAGHAFIVNLPEGEERISLISYEPFAVVDSVADDNCLFTLTVDDSFHPLIKGELVGKFDCGAADFGVYRLADGGYQILVGPPGGQYCALMQTTADFSEGIIATRGEHSIRSFAVNNALMLMYAFSAATKGTLLIHASVIANKGYGYLFLGKSGTGKSTHSNLWLKHVEGSELLNDDNPVIVITESDIRVYGSPWSGKTPCYKNLSATIGAFVRIKQEPENHICRELPLQSFAVLLPSMSTMKWDKRIYDGVCSSVSQLVERVPLYTLGCRPDREAAEVCSAAIMSL